MKRESASDSLANLILPVALIFGLVLLLSFNVEQPRAEIEPRNFIESWLKVIVNYLAVGAEIAAALVIAGAVLRGIITYISQLTIQRSHHYDSTELIRLKLGRMLTLGLEFTVASDILRTAVAPTRADILSLGEIVLLRTLLNYFLEREIKQAEQSRFTSQERS